VSGNGGPDRNCPYKKTPIICGQQEICHPVHILGPAGGSHGTKKCPFVDEVDAALAEVVRKEISQDNPFS